MADPTLRVRQTLDNSQFKKGLRDSQQSAKALSTSMKAIGGAIAGAFAIGAVASFYKTSLDGLHVEEQATAQLLNSLKGRKDVTDRLIDQAKELARNTLYEDDQIISAQSMLAVFVKQESQLRSLMPLVLDFATKFKMDVASAANLVGKSLGSSTNALKRYGFEIEGAVGSSERFESALQALSSMSGAAEAAANTNAGAVQQLGKAWGEFGESLVSLTGPALTKLAKGLTEVTTAATDFVDEKRVSGWTKFWAMLAGGTGNAAWSAEILAKNVKPAVEETTTAVEEIIPPLVQTDEELEQIAKEAEKAAQELQKLKDSVAEGNIKNKLDFDIDVSRAGKSDRELTGDLIGGLETIDEIDFSQAVPSDAMMEGIAAWDEYTAKVEESAQRIQSAMEQMGAAVGTAIGEFIKGEAKFSDVATSLIQEIIKVVAGYLTETVAASFAGGASAGGPAAAFTGAAAAAAALSMFGAIVPALMAKGGTVPTGFPGDTYPALLSSGETVLPAPHKLDAMAGAQRVIVEGRIRGQDIYFANEKQTSKLSRYR